MKRRAFFTMLLLGLLAAGHLHAAQANHITASHAWIRLLPGDLPAAGYVALRNDDKAAAMLASASTGAFASTMLHESTEQANGMSRMTMVRQLPIPAQGTVALSPSGYHLMLEHAVHPIHAGDSVTITLTFADGSQLPVVFAVRPADTVDAP